MPLRVCMLRVRARTSVRRSVQGLLGRCRVAYSSPSSEKVNQEMIRDADASVNDMRTVNRKSAIHGKGFVAPRKPDWARASRSAAVPTGCVLHGVRRMLHEVCCAGWYRAPSL